MTIEVNTQKMDWVKGETITQLLKRMNYTFPLVVVKMDGTLIPKSEFGSRTVPDSSKVEVIHMISGG